MSYVQNDFSGSLFKNDKREKDTHPNAKGSATIDGVEYWVSAWTKQDKNGKPWQSLSFQKKQPKSEQETSEPVKKSSPQQPSKSIIEMDDDLPF